MWKHFSEKPPFSTATDVNQRLPSSVRSLSFLTQILQQKQGQLSWAHNKRIWSQIPFLERAICYLIYVRCIYGAIYCCPVMGERCGRCVIISCLRKIEYISRAKTAIIIKKDEDCKGGEKSNWKKMHYSIILNIHFYELKLLFIFID